MPIQVTVKDKSAFYDAFQPLSLFGGVYTGNHQSADLMVEEAGILREAGFDAVYLENDERKPDDSNIICKALEQIMVDSADIKIGVNIMPDGTGKEILQAYDIAKHFNLPFIINDEIVGLHTENGKEMQIEYLKYLNLRSVDPHIVILGGINPPYASLVFPNSIHVDLSLARKITDALLVKARKEEPEIPADRIRQYAGDKAIDQFADPTPKTVVLASKLTVDNMERVIMTPYAKYVGGLIVGSALRDEDHRLSRQKIMEIKARRDSIRDKLYS